MEKELLEEVQDRKQQREDEVWKEIEEYISSWETEKRRSCTINKHEDMAVGTTQCDKSGCGCGMVVVWLLCCCGCCVCCGCCGRCCCCVLLCVVVVLLL